MLVSFFVHGKRERVVNRGPWNEVVVAYPRQGDIPLPGQKSRELLALGRPRKLAPPH